MKIAVVGASGAIGSALIPELLHNTTHEIVLFSHHAKQQRYDPADEPRLTHIDGDVRDKTAISNALNDCDIAVYLVHLMGSKEVGSQFTNAEAQAAETFADAANANSVQRVVYVGGMGSDEADLTQHLHSRQQTGVILKERVAQLIELHTPMVVGPRAAGFEVLRSFVDRFKILPLPSWANGSSQPITITDVVRYILASITLKDTNHLSAVIAGPETLTYSQVARRYAAYKRTHVLIIPVPLVSKHLAARIFKLIPNSPSAQTVADMVESASYTTKADPSSAQKYFPNIKPEPIEQAFSLDYSTDG